MKNRKIAKSALGVLLAGCMVMGSVPVSTGVRTYAGTTEGAAESVSNPLTTKWNEAEIGTHTDKGSYTYDKEAQKISIAGSGTKFDKDSAKDDLYYAFFNAKGTITVTTKVQLSEDSAGGQAGIIARNDTESTSPSAALYADSNKGQIRYGYHTETSGGASQVNSDVTVKSDTIYLKLEISEGQATYHVASTADYSDEKVKTQSIAGLKANEIGFFATAGVNAVFTDTKITSENTEDGITTKKVIWDSATGERIPSFTNSAEYGGTYTDAVQFSQEADGNVLKMTAVADESDKGTIRNNKNMDYMLFPQTTENDTISAQVRLSSMSKSTDKVGLFIGQFAFEAPNVRFSTLQFSKNMAAYPHYVNSAQAAGTSGDPKIGNLQMDTDYIMEYAKTADGPIVTFKDASGNVLGTTEELQDWSNYSPSLQPGSAVSYGLAFAGVTAEISNITITDASGYVVYDQNDYYIAKGVAPVVATIDSAAVSQDRDSIDLTWTASAGEGNTAYVVLVSKDGGEYKTAGISKTTSFSYQPDGDGTYQFRIYGKAGDINSATEAKESEKIAYVTPLAQPQLSAAGEDSAVELSWENVEQADQYLLYRAETKDGTYTQIETFAGDTLQYKDSDVTNEQPYYYYLTAVNTETKNTSNPSEIQQVLPTKGHTGKYVCEDGAAKFTVTSKSNDTVLTDQASVAGTIDTAGTLSLEVNGQITATKQVNADSPFSFSIPLSQTRNDVNLYLTDEQGKTTRKTFNFVRLEHYDMLVDAAFTGDDGTLVNGVPCYATVGAAVKAVPSDNQKQVTIFIKNGQYQERVVVTSPYISLIGEDSIGTHIYASEAVADKSAATMWDRNCMYVDSTATGFTMENLTVENSYPYKNGTDEQADALCIVADQTICINVRLVSFQDTLLTDSRVKDETGNYAVTRQYFDKCYITGNVDFIYGAGTSVFHDCDIVARYTQYKADGCFSAARTYATTPIGFVFDSCRFMAEEGCTAGSYRLARPWGADASETFINCYMGSVIQDTGYGDMSGNSYQNARYAEYQTYGPEFVVNNDRPQLSSVQAEAYQAATVFGDFAYEKVLSGLYAKASQQDPETDPAKEKTTESGEEKSSEAETNSKKSEEQTAESKTAESQTAESQTTQEQSSKDVANDGSQSATDSTAGTLEESTVTTTVTAESPATGDRCDLAMWICALCLAMSAMVMTESFRKKKSISQK